MTVYAYKATVYKQNASPNAPTLVSFVAPVQEITKWASVQAYIDETGQGFQRALDGARRDEIAAFFNEPTNCSPTGVSVALRQGSPCWLEPTVSIPDQGQLIQTGVTLNIEMRTDLELLRDLPDEMRTSSVPDLAHRVRQYLEQSGIDLDREARELEGGIFEAQLGSDGEADDDDLDDDEPTFGDAELSPEDTSGEDLSDAAADDGAEEEGVDVGASRLGLIVEGLADEQWVLANWSSLVDLLRPGVVIDGQHRLAGGTQARAEMPFAVTGMLDATLAQQIIQFVLINVNQRKLNPRFTSGVFASYMDREQMEEIAEETGLDMTGPQIFSIMNLDPTRPFIDLIDNTERRAINKLGYFTMVGIGKTWLRRRPRVLKQMFKAYRKRPGETQTEFNYRRAEDWSNTCCWDLCFTFWKGVQGKYPDLWRDLEMRSLPVNHLCQAVVLEQLQVAFLDFWDTQVFNFDRGMSEQERLDHVKSHMTTTLTAFLRNLPSELFTVPWEHGTSLNDAKGRNYLNSFFTLSWRRPQTFRRREASTGQPRWRSLLPVGDTRIKTD